MPKIPAPENYRDNVPSPTYRPVMADENAFAAPGRALSAVGRELENYAAKEQAEVEDLAALQAYAAVRTHRVDLTAGDDGFTRKRGSQALSEPLIDTYSARLQKQIETTRAGLKTPGAQIRFDQRVASELPGLKQDIYRHLATQRGALENDTVKSLQVSYNSMASLGTVGGVSMALADAQKAEALSQQMLGATSTTPELLQAIGWDHSGVAVLKGISAAVTAGSTTNAEAILERYGDKMSDAQKLDAQSLLKGKKDNELATLTANDVAVRMFPVDPKVPRLSLEAGLIEIQKKFASNKEAQHAAVQLLNELHIAHTHDQKTYYGTVTAAIAQSPTQQTLAAVRQSPAYKAMDPDGKNDFEIHAATYMRQARAEARTEWRMDKQETRITREEQKQAREDSYQSIEAMGILNSTINDPTFAKMPREHIEALRFKIGDKNTVALLQEQKRQQSVSHTAKLDAALLAQAIPLDLQKATGDKEKQQLAAFKGTAQAEFLYWKDTNPGKDPTEEDQRKIIARANQQYIADVKTWFGFSSEKQVVPAYKLDPAKYYIDRAPADYALQVKKLAYDRGLPPPTPEEINAGFLKYKAKGGKWPPK